MNGLERRVVILTIISTFVGIFTFAFKEELWALLILPVYFVYVIVHFVSEIIIILDDHTRKISEIEEKLKFYEQLVEVKADIKLLKQGIKK